MREEKSRVLHNAITKSVIIKVKEQVGFLRKLLANLAASLIDDKPNTSGSPMDQTWFM